MKQNAVKSKKDYISEIRQDESISACWEHIMESTGLDLREHLGDIINAVSDLGRFATTKEGLDMRLRIHSGSWNINSGSPDYDQDHRGEVGCGWLCLHGLRSKSSKARAVNGAVSYMIRDLANNI